MIQNTWHVEYPTSFFANPQRQIEILSTVTSGIERPYLAKHTVAYGEHVAYIVIVSKQIDIEVWLEKRIIRPSILAEFILVAIEKIDIGVVAHGFGVLKQKIWLYHIVMVEKTHEIALSLIDACICISRNAPIAFKKDNFDSVVFACDLCYRVRHGLILGTRVNQNELPKRVRLSTHRFNHFIQKR